MYQATIFLKQLVCFVWSQVVDNALVRRFAFFSNLDFMLKVYILESKIDPFNQQSIDSHMHNVCCHTDIDERLENTLQ